MSASIHCGQPIIKEPITFKNLGSKLFLEKKNLLAVMASSVLAIAIQVIVFHDIGSADPIGKTDFNPVGKYKADRVEILGKYKGVGATVEITETSITLSSPLAGSKEIQLEFIDSVDVDGMEAAYVLVSEDGSEIYLGMKEAAK